MSETAVVPYTVIEMESAVRTHWAIVLATARLPLAEDKDHTGMIR
jgi:hypothetical protein